MGIFCFILHLSELDLGPPQQLAFLAGATPPEFFFLKRIIQHPISLKNRTVSSPVLDLPRQQRLPPLVLLLHLLLALAKLKDLHDKIGKIKG